jgi:hypothetical protein
MPEEKQRRGQAKVEFLACKAEIEKLLDEGFTVVAIYDMFTEKYRISVGYYMFCRYIRQYGLGRAQSKKKSGPAAVVRPVSSSVPPATLPSLSAGHSRMPGEKRQNTAAPGTSFVHDPHPDRELFKKSEK